MNIADQLRDLIENSVYGPLFAATLVILFALILWKILRIFRRKVRPQEFESKKENIQAKTLPKESSGSPLIGQVKDERALSKETLQQDKPSNVSYLKERQVLKETRVEEIVSEQDQLSSALVKTRDSFWGRIKTVFGLSPILSSDDIESIEEVLYTSDLGPKTVSRLMATVHKAAKADSKSGAEAFRHLLKAEMLEIFKPVQTEVAAHTLANSNDPLGLSQQFNLEHGPSVWMMVGINGAGKTTTIGKLATLLAEQNKKVLLAAGDTFRAAAGEQLKVWTERAQVEIFNPPDVSDPSAVAFDAVQKAKAKGFDIAIIDTAGRLHTQKNLMEELRKMKRVLAKVLPEAPHETLLVLDANQGQNALLQAKEFHEALGVTGIVLTKLDGTAKGGVALGVANELNIPIKLIGVGEKPRDLRPFSAEEYVNSILGL